MGDFGRDRRGRRDFDRPQIMHKAICSDCGKECEVPFKPSGSKPVFCRDCFQNKRSSDSRSENFPRRSNFEDKGNNQINRPVEQPQYKEQFEALNAKLDKILNLLTPKDLPVKEIETSKPNPISEVEIPIIKKKKPSKR